MSRVSHITGSVGNSCLVLVLLRVLLNILYRMQKIKNNIKCLIIILFSLKCFFCSERNINTEKLLDKNIRAVELVPWGNTCTRCKTKNCIGSEDDGWVFPKEIAKFVQKNWIAYGFGISVDMSYDVAIADWLGIEVHTFDPTPVAIEHVANVQCMYQKNCRLECEQKRCWQSTSYWKNMRISKNINNIIHHPTALGTSNSILQFYPLIRSNEPTIYTLLPNVYGQSPINVKVSTLRDIMIHLNHSKVNILKIDIEGKEPEVLENMLSQNVYPELVLVDFDSARRPHLYKNAARSVLRMQMAGYIVCMNHWWNIAFVHKTVAAAVGCNASCALGCESMGHSTGPIPSRKHTRVLNTIQTNTQQVPNLQLNHEQVSIPNYWSIYQFRVNVLGTSLSIIPDAHCVPIISRETMIASNVLYVADPFIIRKASSLHIFFEALLYDNIYSSMKNVYNPSQKSNGAIGHVMSDDDGKTWSKGRIVLNPDHHLSFPFVFEYQSETYMLPESSRMNIVELYKAVQFPYRWTKYHVLLNNVYQADSSLLEHENLWYLMGYTKHGLTLRYAESPFGPFLLHTLSLNVNRNYRRPGGRLQKINGHIYRIAQVSGADKRYGHHTKWFKIVNLSRTVYQETSSINIFLPNTTLKSCKDSFYKSHHVDYDPSTNFIVADGYK